jgi:hypothetical protein
MVPVQPLAVKPAHAPETHGQEKPATKITKRIAAIKGLTAETAESAENF